MEITYNANVAHCYGKTYIDHRGVLRVRQFEGDYAVLKNVDFGNGMCGFETMSYWAENGTSLIAVHIDSLDGKCIGVVACCGMDFDNPGIACCEIEQTTGIHDVYLEFKVPAGYRCFRFTSRSPFSENSYMPIPDSKIIDVKADTWEATDMLGRRIPSPENCPERRNKKVGMFYWIWHENNARHEPADITKKLAQYPEAEFDENHPTWDTFHAHWAEPLFGYYRNSDPYVIRKHMIMLSNAGVDYLAFDTTNGSYPHKESYTSLFEGMRQAKADGIKVPKIMFMMGFSPNINTYHLLRSVYQDLYKPGLYNDLWYMLDGKPVVMAYPDALQKDKFYKSFGGFDDKYIEEIKNFFTFRPCQPRYDLGAQYPNQWSWLQEYPQHKFGERPDGSCEQMAVGASQNKTDDHPYSRYNIPGSYGRSYTSKDRWNNVSPDSYKYGYNFTEQWEYALENDPDIIFVSGWNEWTVGRFRTKEYIYESEEGSTQLAFVDEFDPEHSRDLEPINGSYYDTYYLQLCGFIRRYKGTAKLPEASGEKTIDINADDSQWADVTPNYLNHKGSTPKRDYPGFGSTLRYVNRTGRNDIISAKVARDTDYIYFIAKCVDNITVTDDENCMTLFLDIDRSKKTGWEGYDFRVCGSQLQKSSDGRYKWKKTADVRKTINGNTVQIAIKKSDLGLGENFDIEFKWSDNNFPKGRNEKSDVMDFYTNGVTAPFGRFNYRYKV